MGFARCEYLFSEVLCPETSTESNLKSQFKSWGPDKWSFSVRSLCLVSQFFLNSLEKSIS